MALFHSDVLCPCCLQELWSWNLSRVCNICGTEATPSRAERLLRRTPRCKQPGCLGFAHDRRCGKCGGKLPADICSYKRYLRFSILGITGSGKTNFLTAMLHELQNALNPPWVLSPMDSNTTALFRENEKSIYNRHEPVAATAAGSTPPPLLWKIKDRSRMTKTSISSYSMTIFDGAGEDCEHINPVISRYIEGSKTLVVLVDPLALCGVASSIPKNILNWSTTSSHDAYASADMVNGLAAYIRQGSV